MSEPAASSDAAGRGGPAVQSGSAALDGGAVLSGSGRGAHPPHLPDRAWDLLVVVLVVALAPYNVQGEGLARPAVLQHPGGAVAVAASLVVLQLRRRFPMAAFIGCGVALVAGAAMSGSTLPFVPAAAIAAFGMAQRLPRRRAAIAVGWRS